MRWKFETLKKGSKETETKKKEKSKETIKCYHLAGARLGDETTNEPEVLQSPTSNSNQTDNSPGTPLSQRRECALAARPGVRVSPPRCPSVQQPRHMRPGWRPEVGEQEMGREDTHLVRGAVLMPPRQRLTQRITQASVAAAPPRSPVSTSISRWGMQTLLYF